MTAPKTSVAVVDPYDANAPENRLSNQTPNPLALAQKTKVGQMLLAEDSPFYALATAAGVPAEALVLELASITAKKPEILNCTKASIIGFMLDAAKLRLGIGRGIYPVPIPSKKGTDQEEWRLEAWVGYKGAKELAMRSGSIRDVWATVHFEGDVLDMEEAPIPRVKGHVFGPNRGDMTKAIGVYATLLYPGGVTRAKYFTRQKIESYKAKNPTSAWKTSPWVTSTEEMWHAKAILHTVGDLPQNSPELAHLGAMLEREERGDSVMLPALPRESFVDGFDPATGEVLDA